MSVLWTSFNAAADSREWFVFDDAGRTVQNGFKTRRMAAKWAWDRMFPVGGRRDG